jgi:hypothetical protein
VDVTEGDDKRHWRMDTGDSVSRAGAGRFGFQIDQVRLVSPGK